MPVYQDEKTKTWYVKLYYTDYTGQRKQKMKRGFALSRDAKAWERDFLERLQGTPEMTFGSLCDLYFEDLKTHTKESTSRTKTLQIKKWILPFWKDKRVNEATAADVRAWQGTIKNSGLAESTMSIINGDLSSIFNFAMRYYNLPSNPCRNVKSIGKLSRSLNFWTLEEFKTFIPSVTDPILHAAFMVLFWGGIREGELLALTVKDFDQENSTITIRGTYNRHNKVDKITPPKTEHSKRVVTLPESVSSEIASVIAMLYEPDPGDRIFQTVTGRKLRYSLDTGAADTGLKRIRVHDLRHSHVSMLIDMGFQPLLIAERIGDSVEMINRVYGHLYPDRHKDVAKRLEELF